MKTMYSAQVNSPGTELAAAIDATQDTIQVADGAVLPEGPNLLTIGTDEAAETILYTVKTGDELTGITRGFQGTAQSWAAGTKVARYFTAYDHDAAISNISELSTGLTAARDRLDIEERQDVVLNAGLQILNAQRRAAFSLSGIKGRTLVNLLGRTGGMENLSGIAAYQTTIALDTTIKDQGQSSLKITLTAGQGSGAIPISYKAGKYYVAIGRVKNGNATHGYIAIPGVVQGTFITDATAFRTSWLRYAPVADGTNSIDSAVVGTSGQYAHFDAVRFYEISAEDYAALDGMSPEQVAAKFPYVDSVQPVRNPYAIRYGENLLPPFYEWTVHPTAKMADAYTLVQTATGPTQNTKVLIPIQAGETYTLSYLPTEDSSVAYINIQWLDASGGSLGYTPKNTNGQTVTAPDGAVIAHVLTGNTAAGTFTFKNPMLTLGTTPKPFKPREDSMLALQTDLYADPLTSANADEVFEKDGQYFKLTKWKKTIMNGSEDVSYGSSALGYKTIRLPKVDRDFSAGFYITKYDGKQLTYSYNAVTGADQFRQGPGESFLFLTVSNTDSGWGDNYTPTADEIKAYFMGWKMWQGDSNDSNIPYTSGTKRWRSKTSGDEPSVLPTTQAPNWTPYQLVYQLATPTVEPIVSEGMLTFNEGDNQIEVGTGIVLRESVKPQLYNGVYFINSTILSSSGLTKMKPIKFLSVFKDNKVDTAVWSFYSDAQSFGITAQNPAISYDLSAAYSVTYMMLDKSPIVPFSGSYAANEKAMLQELTDVVQQNATAVSVLMNKKSDKDVPGWITPTLLNGWTSSSIAYKKMGSLVIFRGSILNGAVGAAPVFILPVGYRPAANRSIGVLSRDTNNVYAHGRITVSPSGVLVVDIGPNGNVFLDGTVFEAEQ